MGKKENGKVIQKILSVLEQETKSYSEIRRDLEKEYDITPEDRVLTYQLQKLSDLGLVEEDENQEYTYTGDLGEEARKDIDSMLERVIEIIFDEYGGTIPDKKLIEIIQNRTEKIIDRHTE